MSLLFALCAGSTFAQSKIQSSAKIRIQVKKAILPFLVKDNSIKLNKNFQLSEKRRDILISIKKLSKNVPDSNVSNFEINKSFIQSNQSIKDLIQLNFSQSSEKSDHNNSSKTNSLPREIEKNIVTIVY